jgi:hypothetical protein
VILEHLDVAEQPGARIAALQKIVTENPILGESAVERLLECVDVIDALADERALADPILVDVGNGARVRIDTGIAAVQARVDERLAPGRLGLTLGCRMP